MSHRLRDGCIFGKSWYGNDGLKDKTNPVYRCDDRDISYYHAIYWDGIRSFLSEQYGDIAHFAGAILLIGLGFYIVYSSILENEETRTAPIGISLFVFAFGVSIDSFSVGLSLGIYGAQTIITILLFGFVSMLLAWIGLLIGRHAKGMLGTYGEIVGGIILVGFGLHLLFLYNFKGRAL